MSGIAGIVLPNNAHVERGLLKALADYLAFRGPDAQAVWTSGGTGLAHALLRTTRESANEHQPATLDGRFTVTADVRLDARAELRAAIEAGGYKLARAIADPELVLHAYALWGRDCVSHLRGDFAFAIWDAREHTLFCARDHFGIKPFYYVDFPGQFVFSNTLDCLRAHPDVSGELNHAAIADFLLFGLNCDPATTSYRDIRRLPPAHSLTSTAGGIRVERYWSPPIDGCIRYRHSEEYVEHFQNLLQQAVADRLRVDRVGIFLSGGLDSGAVATIAREVSSPPLGEYIDLRAYTAGYESLYADPEIAYARSTAKAHRIPIRLLPADGFRPFEFQEDAAPYPEPVDDPLFGGLFEQFRTISQDCRVILSGEGNDNLMHFQMWPQLRGQLRNRDWLHAMTNAIGYLRVRRMPWRGIQQRVRSLLGKDPYSPVYPRWVAPEFARRMKLEARWRESSRRIGASSAHPLLPKAHASLALPHWSCLFEQEEPGVTRVPVEVRYPFLDLRLVNFLLALPPFPYLFEKTTLREAMAGRLPEAVRTRPKTPLGVDPLALALKHHGTAALDNMKWNSEAKEFIDVAALAPIENFSEGEALSVRLRPHCLNFWLQSVRRPRYNFLVEARNG